MSLSSLLFARLRSVVYRHCRCTSLDIVVSVDWLKFKLNRLFSEYPKEEKKRLRIKNMSDKKLIYPAAERNKDPILQVLKRYVRRGIFLEIASGSGQHVAHFAPHFPQVVFYPSERDSRLLESIEAHSHGSPNIKRPIYVDVTTSYRTWGHGAFQPNSVDYIYNANMIHISPYTCTVGLFDNAGLLLQPNGLLITYGPYAFDGHITPESNVVFDKNLRSQHSEWGLRDVNDLKELAKRNNITLLEIVDMPANNKTIIWRKCASA